MKRTAFFISDGTGITSEALGQSLLAQFEDIEFEKITLPYIDTEEKAREVVRKINKAAENDHGAPLVFDTIVDKRIRAEFKPCKGFIVDIFGTFLEPLEKELNTVSSYTVGTSHSIAHNSQYERRIEAVNYALDNDDGARTKYYSDADVILIGVSRSGKTPTCLYLALQYGIKAANYPLTDDDILDQKLPAPLRMHKHKLFGLSIDPDRLSLIRNERKPNSKYASIKQCYYEVEEVELMYKRERVPYMDTTDASIEEIATRVKVTTGIQKRIN
jgi:regulator of PEP synthase PpsR (kinase-PPPase family)